MVLLCSISQGEGILGPSYGVDCRSSRRSSSDLPASCVVLRTVFSLDLWLDDVVGLGKMWGRGSMVDVLSLQELGEFIGCKGRATISVDVAGQSVLGDEFLQLLGEGIG